MRSVVEVAMRQAAEQPTKTAYTYLEDGDKRAVSLTYSQIDARARAIAALVRAAAGGGPALLLYPPGLDYVQAYFGCLYGGIIAVPAYPPDPTRLERTLPRLQRIVADAGTKIILTTAPIKNLAMMFYRFAPELASLVWIATDEVPANAALDYREPELDRESLAFLQYTSGSTSDPKGVMVTHGNLLHNLAAMTAGWYWPESVTFSWLPMYHDMGLIGGILCPLYSGTPAVLMSPIDFMQRPIRWLTGMTRHRATTTAAPNFAYDLVAQKITEEQRQGLDLSTLAVALNGAEPVRADTIERFTRAFAAVGFRREAFFPAYGLAEATLAVSAPVRLTGAATFAFRPEPLQQHVVEPADEASVERLLTATPVGEGGSGDRRRQARLETELTVETVWHGFSSRHQMLNVSLGGVFVRTTSRLPCGAILTLRLLPGPGEPALETRAEVLRVESRADTETSGMALRFVLADEAGQAAFTRTLINILTRVASERLQSPQTRLVSSGHVIGGQTVAIVDPETLVRCHPNRIGEIWVAGGSVAKGYWKRPEETQETFGAHLSDTGEGPFLRTGDYGFMRDGHLFIAGRRKDVVIVYGKNHYPQDIERTVEAASPAQLRPGSGAAFSVPIVDREEVVVVQEVNRKPAARATNGDGAPRAFVSLETIVEDIRNAVTRDHDLPVFGVVLIEQGTISKTSSGKLQRRACRAAYLRDTLEVLASWQQGAGLFIAPEAKDLWGGAAIVRHATETPPPPAPAPEPAPAATPPPAAETLAGWITRQLSERLGIKADTIALDRAFADYGLDSKESMGLLGDLADKVGRSLPPTLFARFPNLGSLLTYLDEGDRPAAVTVPEVVPFKPRAQSEPRSEPRDLLSGLARGVKATLGSFGQDRMLQATCSRFIEAAAVRHGLRSDPGRWKPGEPLKLLLAGYQGGRNTGADVRVEEIVRQFRAIFGDEHVQLAVLTIDPALTAGYFRGARQVRMPLVFPRFLYDEVARHHGVVACEGSMFKSKFAAGLTTMMATALGIASAETKLSVGYGGEAGKMDPALADFVQEHVRDSLVICRNEPSRTVLEKLGIRTRPGTDTAWTFTPASADRGAAILRQAGWNGQQPVLAVCPINPFWWPIKPDLLKAAAHRLGGRHREEHYRSIYFHHSSREATDKYERYLGALAGAIRRFGERRNVFTVLIGMEQLDRRACADLAGLLGRPVPQLVSDEFDMYDLVSVLRNAHYLASSRYHAVVTSMPALVPSVGVTMDERLRNLMRDRGQPDLVLEVDDEHLEERLFALLQRMDREGDAMAHGIARAIPRQLQLMGQMGIDLMDEVARVYPDFPRRKVPRSWEHHLPSLSPEISKILERAA